MSEISFGEWLEAIGPNRGASYPGRPIPPLRLNDASALTDAQLDRLARMVLDDQPAFTDADTKRLGRMFNKESDQ